MQEHPVPQQISSYSFKLVGDMTLKQFFEVAGGVGVGILFYITGLPGVIKWPLILISVITGGALAFIPFEERPLEQWIFAFFRSIYSPTLFYWKKLEARPQYFQKELPVIPEQFQKPKEQVQEIEAIKPEILAQIQKKEVQKADTQTQNFLSNLENTEKAFLSQINNLFSLNLVPPKPSKVHPDLIGEKPSLTVPPTLKVAVSPSSNIPKVEKVIIPAQNVQVSKVSKTLKSNPILDAMQAQFTTNVPSMPTQSNTITGQILDTTGKIVEGAIIEIRDAAGRPARALRSNKAGHFLISIPFSNGKYEIIVEKEGLAFTPVSFEATGGIIPPILIKADKEVVIKDIFQNEKL
ncbi:MAG: PrgI family protein [Candidatus Woesebacteria bacterium]|nr:MAG: PrgI family protein [Candidatus Woesebacteria bacterium]